jgi:hypothetical protein
MEPGLVHVEVLGDNLAARLDQGPAWSMGTVPGGNCMAGCNQPGSHRGAHGWEHFSVGTLTAEASGVTFRLTSGPRRVSQPGGPFQFPGSEYYGGSAPRLAAQPTTCPARPATLAARRWASQERFPCSLRFAHRRRSPALPQRPRREYAADLPRSLPFTSFTAPGSSPLPQPRRVRAAPGPYPPGSRSQCKR